jgi:F-type H+-transporting ATPase subunit delta
MAESLDQQLAVADIYAAALFDLALEADAIETVRDELEELVKLEQSEPDFAAFMASSALAEERRAAGLEKMFRDRLSDLVLNTLLVMNAHERCGLLAVLLRRYIERQEAHANQVEVVATSAVELTAEQQKDVTATAAAITGKTPLVTFEVDPDVIGGLIVQIEDWRYDNSVRRQLKRARSRLADRAERGLEVGVGD